MSGLESCTATASRLAHVPTCKIQDLTPGDPRDALFDLRSAAFAGGAVNDPVASLLLCASPQAAWTVVNGRVAVREGRLAIVDLGPLLERHNAFARRLALGA